MNADLNQYKCHGLCLRIIRLIILVLLIVKRLSNVKINVLSTQTQVGLGAQYYLILEKLPDHCK